MTYKPLLLLLILSILMPVRADIAAHKRHELDYLLGLITRSPCVFAYNQRQHSGQQTAQHLQYRYQNQRRDIVTSEDFIRQTTSPLPGQPVYRVNCGQGGEVLLSAWLLRKLESYRLIRRY